MAMPTRQKLLYLLDSASKRLRRQGAACPSCGSDASELVARKHWITQLRRCGRCLLLFRVPTTAGDDQSDFYQQRYSQGFTTQLPSEGELARLVDRQFKGTEKDYSTYVDVLSALGVTRGARVLDFGCSWGYGSWQLQRAGLRVVSFEISRPRCRYALERLDVDAHHDLEEISGPFDVFFSAHVLEHVPVVSDVISVARRLLRPGGLFVAFTPNGSQALRDRQFAAWMQLWGLVHPNLMDPLFYQKAFALDRWLLASSPYDLPAIAAWKADSGNQESRLDGDELLLVAEMRAPV